MTKAHLFAFRLQRGKLFQGHVALDRQVLERGAQVLANGQDVDRCPGS